MKPDPTEIKYDSEFERDVAYYLNTDPEFRKAYFETLLEIARARYRDALDRLAGS